MKQLRVVAFVLLLLTCLMAGASAQTLSIGDGQVDAIGATDSVNITLDVALAGLSGYNISITVDDPTIATIESVSFPSWAGLKSNSTLPAASCWIKAIDTAGHVQNGSADIRLATVTLKGLKSGVTPVTITPVGLGVQDDADLTYDPSLDPGTFTVNVPVVPVAAFSANTTTGFVPLTVAFTDESTGPPTSWAWDFQDDGITDSSAQNPVFTFATPGTYTVNLTATNLWGSDSETRYHYITVKEVPTLTITSPAGGEVWQQGTTHLLQWTYTGDPGATVRIEALRGTKVLATIASSYPVGSGGTGTYSLSFPYNTPVGNDYYIRVTSTAYPTVCSDTSDAPFTVIPALTVVTPNGGEDWHPDSTETIRWTYAGNPGSAVKVEIIRGSTPLAVLTPSTPMGTEGTGSFNFTFPSSSPPGTTYWIRVTSTSYPGCTDTSDAPFAISLLPSITVVAPNGGEDWPAGSPNTIRWRYIDTPGADVKIELLKGEAVQEVITASTPIGSGGVGSYTLAIPAGLSPGNDYRVRITSTSNASYTDTSDAPFTISEVPSIAMESPNGGENWTQGSTQTLRWNYTGNPGSTVKIEAIKGAKVLATVTSSYPIGPGGSGTFNLTFPYNTPLGNDYWFRVTSNEYPVYNDTSDAPFTVLPAITVAAPNGGEVWQQGSTQTLRWNYTGNPGSMVKIEALRSGAFLATIASSYPIGSDGEGSFNLTFPTYTPLGSDYQIRVTSTSYPACSDASDTTFEIVPP